MERLEGLFDAVVAGDAGRVAALVLAQPDLARSRGPDGVSAMQLARYLGRPALVDALVGAGPPLDVFEAAQLGRDERIIELLTDDPELVHAYSSDGFTALHFAAYYGCPETVALLIGRGASLAAVTRNFLANMPLHAAAAGRGPILDVCELLLRAGADANAKQHGGFTPLHTAGHRGDLPLARLLLAHGAAAAAMDDGGGTAADTARAQGHVELAAFLRAAAAPARA